MEDIQQIKTSKKDKLIKNLIFFLILSIFAFPDQIKFSLLIRSMTIIIVGYFNVDNIRIDRYVIWALTFIFVSTASILWAVKPDIALDDVFKIIQALVICILLTQWIDGPNKFSFILKIIIISSIVFGIRVLLDYPFDSWGNRRIGYLLDINVNTISIRIAFGAIITSYYYLKNVGFRKLINLITLLFLTFIIIILGSRRSIFSLLLGVFIVNFSSSKNIFKLIKVMTISIITGIIILYLMIELPALYTIVGFRIETMIKALISGNTIIDNSRNVLIINGLDLFTQKPFLGWGIGNYSIASGLGRYSHNNYIELLSSIGLLGFIVFYSLHFFLIFRFISSKFKLKEDGLMFSLFIVVILSDSAAPSYSALFMLLILALTFTYFKSVRKDIFYLEYGNKLYSK